MDDFDIIEIVNSAASTKTRTNQDSRESSPEPSAPVEISFEIDEVLSSTQMESLTDPRTKTLVEVGKESLEITLESSSDQIHLSSLDQDSICSDEWENDDDLGYVTVQLTEQEFFEMEEVCSF
jgi:hypothetical protein